MMENILLYFIDLIVVLTMVFKISITVEDNDLKVLREVLESIYSTNTDPEATGIFYIILLLHRLISLTYQMILFITYTPFLNKIT